MPNSQTLVKTLTVSGVGLHTGTPVRVEVHPCAEGGIVVRRDGVTIPARVEYVVDTRRCTTLGRDGVRVSTVEHLLAALVLAGIDHAEIVVDGPELPALDGSALAWHTALMAAGIRPLDTPAPAMVITDVAWIADGASEFFLAPRAEPAFYTAIAVPDTVAARMAAGGPTTDTVVREQILRARTYALESEVQALLDAGLARGGSLDNAVILTRDGYRNTHVWPCEPAWHKVLDLIGDLALVGARIIGQVIAVRAGHRSHTALAARLRATEPL